MRWRRRPHATPGITNPTSRLSITRSDSIWRPRSPCSQLSKARRFRLHVRTNSPTPMMPRLSALSRQLLRDRQGPPWEPTGQHSIVAVDFDASQLEPPALMNGLTRPRRRTPGPLFFPFTGNPITRTLSWHVTARPKSLLCPMPELPDVPERCAIGDRPHAGPPPVPSHPERPRGPQFFGPPGGGGGGPGTGSCPLKVALMVPITAPAASIPTRKPDLSFDADGVCSACTAYSGRAEADCQSAQANSQQSQSTECGSKVWQATD